MEKQMAEIKENERKLRNQLTQAKFQNESLLNRLGMPPSRKMF